MIHQKILEEVMRRAKKDTWCTECLKDVQQRESKFLAVRSRLPTEEQEQLDLYIGACEAFCDSHIFVAYQLGKEHKFWGL